MLKMATNFLDQIRVQRSGGKGCSHGPNTSRGSTIRQARKYALSRCPAPTPDLLAKHVPGYVEKADAFAGCRSPNSGVSGQRRS